MSFAPLGLSEPVLKAVAETGYVEPTPIQAQAIPVVLTGRDVLGETAAISSFDSGTRYPPATLGTMRSVSPSSTRVAAPSSSRTSRSPT